MGFRSLSQIKDFSFLVAINVQLKLIIYYTGTSL